MPRFYIFTVIISMTLGILTYKILTTKTDLPYLILYAILWALVYLNEKTAALENLIPNKLRKYVGLALGISLAAVIAARILWPTIFKI